jgi:hypothetical protein
MVRRVEAVKLIALGVLICLVLLPVSSLNLVQFGGKKDSSSCLMLFLP